MYKSNEIAERIKKLAKIKNIQIKDMLESCGVSKNLLSTMQSGGSLPKSDNLAKIADYLECSVDYLLGRVTTVELLDLDIKQIKDILLMFPDVKDKIILEKDIIQPPNTILKGTKDYFVEAVNYNKIIEIYDKAAEFNSNKIIDKDAYEDLFEYYKLLGTDFGRGYKLSKENYEEFKKVYDLYIRSFAEKIFISFRK